MRERDAIKEVYEKFIISLRDTSFDDLKAIIRNDAKFSFSMLEKDTDLREITKQFTFDHLQTNIRRLKTSNIVIKHTENYAIQSAYILFLYAYDNGSYLYPLEFGGKILIEYEKSENWKISSVKFDLDWEKGNTFFVNEWNLINYEMFAGHELQIVSEFDSPWAKKQEFFDDRSEEEKCRELFAQYAWGVDNADWSLLMDTWSEDITSIMPRGNLEGKREFLKDIKKTRFKEPTMQHACKVHDIHIINDTATMKAYRMEPHRLGSKILHRGNLSLTYYSAKYDFTLKKCKGDWKFCKVNYHGGVFSEPDDLYKVFIESDDKE